MRRDAERWNRSQPHEGFISITMRVEGRQRLVSLPPAAAEPMRAQDRVLSMQLSVRCDWSGVLLPRHVAIMMPRCIFSIAIAGIRGAIDALPEVTSGCVPIRDAAENMVRFLGGERAAERRLPRFSGMLRSFTPDYRGASGRRGETYSRTSLTVASCGTDATLQAIL